MRVLGIDPGTQHCGWGVVETLGGSRLGHVAHGVLSPGTKLELPARLASIHAGLVEVITTHKPEAVSVEEIFFAVNAHSALVLGHARGVALLAAAQAGLTVASYPPATVKQGVVGSGRADKEQVRRMVGVLLGMKVDDRHDASDALALAITHLLRAPMTALVAPKPRR